MKSINFLKSGMTACTVACFCTAVLAAAPTFKEAVSDYSGGKYKVALTKFSVLTKTNSANPTLHYYSAMCYQNLGQLSEARAEYQFVATNGDATLKSYAQRALATLGKKAAPDTTGASTINGMGMLTTVTPELMKAPAPPPQGAAPRLR